MRSALFALLLLAGCPKKAPAPEPPAPSPAEPEAPAAPVAAPAPALPAPGAPDGYTWPMGDETVSCSFQTEVGQVDRYDVVKLNRSIQGGMTIGNSELRGTHTVEVTGKTDQGEYLLTATADITTPEGSPPMAPLVFRVLGTPVPLVVAPDGSEARVDRALYGERLDALYSELEAAAGEDPQAHHNLTLVKLNFTADSLSDAVEQDWRVELAAFLTPDHPVGVPTVTLGEDSNPATGAPMKVVTTSGILAVTPCPDAADQQCIEVFQQTRVHPDEMEGLKRALGEQMGADVVRFVNTTEETRVYRCDTMHDLGSRSQERAELELVTPGGDTVTSITEDLTTFTWQGQDD